MASRMNSQKPSLQTLAELNAFFAESAVATWAGSGKETKSDSGLRVLTYSQLKPSGKWDYQDTYSGFYQSWGREIVTLNGKIIWSQNYGGGTEEKYIGDKDFAEQTFGFLKKALSAGDKEKTFQPRGPEMFYEGPWTYYSRVKGDITKFEGEEMILYGTEIVFRHKFFGGLVINGE